ncbi:MAG: SusD/RagB family nutrient-binding outer membrane lipoprotein [Bacteroidales bacterium]|nr:SusD/RagB family nutrient-binding outer membrane lipoprotein [Bacteroidales bacterium]
MINILKTNILLITIVAFSGCNWIDTDLNIDPDSPADVPVEFLLPNVQVSSAYNLGGNNSVRITNIWMQFFDELNRSGLIHVSKYQLYPEDINNLWSTAYAQSMMDCKKMIEKADEVNSPHYAGIAKIMLALNIGVLTNLFGDMPYSDAFSGSNSVLQPAYDSQESVYAAIDDLLNQAISELGQEENAVDIKQDLIYDGDISMWIKAAYALRARHAFYKGENSDALNYIAGSFDTGENFSLAFESGNNQNPIYQFMRDRTDIRMASTFIDMLIANNDPRLPYYATQDDFGLYSGSYPGSGNSLTSHPGSYNASETSPVLFSSYSEMKFIEAEILLSSDANSSVTAFQEGVAASISDVTGSVNQAWLDANINNIDPGNLTLQDIIKEKYKAMYSTVIPYDDYRRTGFPILQEVENALYASPPLRFPYPESEILYNENTPLNISPFTSLWIFQ